MLRILEIVEKKPYYLVCKFNNGDIRKLEVLPIIENHKHLNGVMNLLNSSIFNTVSIGNFGEIVWEKVVKTNQDGKEILWDYDISPEFVFENSNIAELITLA